MLPMSTGDSDASDDADDVDSFRESNSLTRPNMYTDQEWNDLMIPPNWKRKSIVSSVVRTSKLSVPSMSGSTSSSVWCSMLENIDLTLKQDSLFQEGLHQLHQLLEAKLSKHDR